MKLSTFLEQYGLLLVKKRSFSYTIPTGSRYQFADRSSLVTCACCDDIDIFQPLALFSQTVEQLEKILTCDLCGLKLSPPYEVPFIETIVTGKYASIVLSLEPRRGMNLENLVFEQLEEMILGIHSLLDANLRPNYLIWCNEHQLLPHHPASRRSYASMLVWYFQLRALFGDDFEYLLSLEIGA